MKEGKSMEKAAEIHALEFVPPEEKWKEHHEIEFNKRRSSFIAGWQEREPEIERLKGLIEKAYTDFNSLQSWERFKLENNL